MAKKTNARESTPSVLPRMRQGDVYLLRTDEPIPTDAKPVQRERGRVVLAYGEVTGHAHVIEDEDVELFTTTADAVDRWLRVGPKGATLTHDEHGPIVLAPGAYKVRIQREYSPEAIRNVAD